MNRNEHVVIADGEGFFYCRAVDSILNYKMEQQVCGRGCPCFINNAENYCGKFVCCYEEGVGNEPALFPFVQGLKHSLYKAYAYAAEAHKGQCRKGTDIPYFTHIITTMNYVVELTDDMEVLQAAILHDTVEDTWVTFEDLRREFGARVAELVEAETENKRHNLPAPVTWEIRKRETIASLKNREYDAKVIVLADKTANLESLVKEHKYRGEAVWKKFNQTDKKKQEWYYRSIREQLAEFNRTSVMRQYDAYLEILF
ncbi:MAG: bifunctional (p)ppGpp synthetase/guanosine-3',5'-bis(diphosphate) 3'-pyrophosphohydrolase [Lachnospiraceae bacterium]|nr:bifunctional (p)ppGpp synthetase/guanosine-3',5'-bis(diphosphate) 3'-pyrophosphohydrolase [Lachnospiraceae bacterium]